MDLASFSEGNENWIVAAGREGITYNSHSEMSMSSCVTCVL